MKFNLQRLGKNVNSTYHESAPLVAPDGKTLYFVRTNHPDNKKGENGGQDIWFSEMQADGFWGKAQHMKSPLNNRRFNEVMWISPTGQYLLVRGGNSKKEDGLAITTKTSSGWSSPKAITVKGYNKMKKGRFSGATMSSDMAVLILYFSEKPDDKFSDLYVSKRIGGTEYSAPLRLTNLNTRRDEFAPFLSLDDKTLYFASNRPGGNGGMDIYRSERLDDTFLRWSKPENVGPPVNTVGFDAYFSLDQEGKAYTTRTYPGTTGNSLDILGLLPKPPVLTLSGSITNEDDQMPLEASINVLNVHAKIDTFFYSNAGGFYEIAIPDGHKYDLKIAIGTKEYVSTTFKAPKIKQDSTMYFDFALKAPRKLAEVYGVVMNKKTNEPIEAEIKITGAEEFLTNSAAFDGGYSVEVAKEGTYEFSINIEGFIGLSVPVEIEKHHFDEGYPLDFYLTPLEVGTTVRLDNVFFDFDRASLKASSFEALDKVVQLMEKTPNLQIEIAGHTDNVGNNNYNKTLSRDRAAAVRAYLVEQGISDWRITSKGYGAEKPQVANDSDDNRAINRRVEFTILDI
ncbi:OmpA family protein [Persicobacter psychrovividus]